MKNDAKGLADEFAQEMIQNLRHNIAAEKKKQTWQDQRLGSNPPFHERIEEEMKEGKQYPLNGVCIK